MHLLTLSKISAVIGLSLFSLSAYTNEHPTSDSLVGETYLGLHGMKVWADDNRLLTSDKNSVLDTGSGIGVEIGYRVSPNYETRFSVTRLNIDTKHKGYNEPTGSSIALDILYFPFKGSFYTVFGADFLDLDKSNLSGDIGAGYRHYLSENSAIYLEGKSHFQFDDDYVDFSSKIGFIYFFDKKTTSFKPTKKAEIYTPPKSLALKDNDKDGVPDQNDKCPNSSTMYKVDSDGCTVFIKDKQSIKLLVNFDNDKSDIDADGLEEIAKVAEFMKEYHQTHLTVHGHTSSQGKAEYNLKLSKERAQAIVEVLTTKFAITEKRLIAVGHGEEQLINEKNSRAAHVQNRRIEAVLTAAKKVPVKR
jgi:OOP family OmpA-OmpF porin